jgi:Tfp pilus assembly protein PilN
MAVRTSIELHPTGCRLVEVTVSPRKADPAATDVRVRVFADDIPAGDDGAALTARLSSLRLEKKLAREAWVTIWGLRTAHQFLRLPPARPADLQALAAREAKKDLTALEADGDCASIGILLGGEVQVGAHRRREVSLVAASGSDVARRIQPIVDAGFTVGGVLTPALALTAVARGASDTIAAGSASAYVMLTARATCLAIIRNGVLLFAREMPWGHDGEASARGVGAQAPEGQEPVATRLASELRRSVLFFKQTFRAPVEQVVLCGDMPKLRALTAPLGEALNVTVKTLDSLVGIDAVMLPEPAEKFRAIVAALRPAIATGGEASPPINLLPANILSGRESRLRLLQLGAAAAASLLIVVAAWYLAGRSAARSAIEQESIQQQLATLEPEARQRDELRQRYALATAQRAALGAFGSQGPRMARLFEALSQAAPDEIVLTSVNAAADGVRWNVSVSGLAITGDAAGGQAAVNRFLESLTASPFVGAPTQPPSLRMISGTTPTAGGVQRTIIPEGMSGVEFTVTFSLAK